MFILFSNPFQENAFGLKQLIVDAYVNLSHLQIVVIFVMFHLWTNVSEKIICIFSICGYLWKYLFTDIIRVHSKFSLIFTLELSFSISSVNWLNALSLSKKGLEHLNEVYYSSNEVDVVVYEVHLNGLS